MRVPRPRPTRPNSSARWPTLSNPATPRRSKQTIGWALADGKTLELIGRGTKRAIGRAAQWDATLDLSGLSGVTLYEPEELVLSAKAGTPLAEIEALVAASKQELAFEPMDYGALLGGEAGAGTIGGAIAANLSGPRRIKAGAARDHFLGVSAVSGRGETFKSGGRVVKNVTGYDLCKLIAGSWGTLAAMTDVTIKTLPKAETEADDPGAQSRRCDGAQGHGGGDGLVRRCLGGRASAGRGRGADRRDCRARRPRRPRSASKASRRRWRSARAVLEKLLAPFGALGTLGEAPSRALWRAIRDVTPFAAKGPPASAISGASRPRRRAAPKSAARSLDEADAEVLYDWAGGLVWAALPRGGRRPCAAGARNRRRRRRPRHADSRAGRGARRGRRVHAGAGAARGIDRARAQRLRSAGRAQCRTHVGGRVDMQTSFTLAQLADPDVAESEKILRACVHCGFCTATCPTYVLDGNELDSPRGRIYLIKDMLEHDRPATAEVTVHIDRCLSCLACMTTCPSGVHYMHLVDHARVHIEETYRRPLGERLLRAVLAKLMPYPRRFRLALQRGAAGQAVRAARRGVGLKRLAAMLAPGAVARRRSARSRRRRFPADGARKAPRRAARRLRQRRAGARDQRRRDPRADAPRHRGGAAGRRRLLRLAGPSHGPRGRGAGAGARQYRRLDRDRRPRRDRDHRLRLRHHGQGLRVHAARRSGLRRRAPPASRASPRTSPNISPTLPLEPGRERAAALVVAYHSACSLQHGQRITRQPKELLAKLGFVVKDVPEGHLCCGSAGTYNILQPDIARTVARA